MEDNTRINSVPVVFGDAAISVFKIQSRQTLLNGIDPRGKNLQHTHVYYEYHLITGETASFYFGDERIEVQEDAFIVIPPGIRHSPRQPADPGNVVLAIALEPCTGKSGYYHTFRKALSEGGCRAVPLEKAQAKRIKQLFTVMESSGLRDSCLRQALAYEMVFTVLDRLQGVWISEEIQETGQPEEKTNITLDWMVNDMRLSLSDIAGELGYTTRHTARLIRQQYGMRLGDIRRNRILTTAKRLLLQYPEVSLNQIAVQAGFPSGDSMKRAFLKWENTTPAEYRENFYKGDR